MELRGRALAVVDLLFLRRNKKAPGKAGPDIRAEHGLLGEKAAARFLKKEGYTVLVRNYRVRWGEIDLVCRHHGVLVFVEVKTRSPGSWAKPSQAVTPSKQRRIIRAAYSYLRELEEKDMPVRFDVVEVLLEDSGMSECTLIRSAFDLPEKYARNSG